MRYSEANAVIINDGTISDGVVVDTTNVTLTNSESGRIIGGVAFAQAGNLLVNELGGIIRVANGADPLTTLAVTGSAGSDRFMNAGAVTGLIALGDGNDIYVDRDAATSVKIGLGGGDDLYRLEGSKFRFLQAEGGTGWDTLVMANTNFQVDGGSLTGFEELILEEGGNIQRFSGFQRITLLNRSDTFNFLDSSNPLLDIELDGQSIGLQRSSFHSITGNAARDSVDLGSGALVTGSVSLGGGDDWVRLSGADLRQVSGSIDAGTGRDTLELYMRAGEDRSFDLSKLSGFEALWANSSYMIQATMRVSNVTGVNDIRIGRSATLVLEASTLPAANISGGFGGTLVLASGSTIGRFGLPLEGGWDQRVDLAQADDTVSAALTNAGTIVGEVRFSIGDDVYDGSAGTTGGIVYGNAGNDRLIGGAGVDRFQGGYGADLLWGGDGADLLSGDAGRDELAGGGGADIMAGGAGIDLFRGTRAELAGDTILDFERGETIRITDADIAAVTSDGNRVDLGGGLSLTVNGVGGRLLVQAATDLSDGVVVTSVAAVRDDINGDGRADILWRNDNGALTNWLGRSDGAFVGNDAAALYTGIPTSLKVDAIADFNGDGRNDILWRGDNGALTNWLGRLDGGFAGNDAAAFVGVPISWSVAGAGDFNGDGRADILWRNNNGALTNWLGRPDGGFVGNDATALYTGIAASLKVAAIADFNGDGRDDILWRGDNGALTNWLGRPDGGFVGNDAAAFVGVPTSWTVAGSGDFNGDGRADILWRNDNGALTDWLGRPDGGFVGNDAAALYTNIPASLKVAAVADYNGDGRDDILWRSDSGALTNWLGRPDGGFVGNDAAAFVHVPLDWHV
jgi:hypothetical protein